MNAWTEIASVPCDAAVLRPYGKRAYGRGPYQGPTGPVWWLVPPAPCDELAPAGCAARNERGANVTPIFRGVRRDG
jgi:hypothetical protein